MIPKFRVWDNYEKKMLYRGDESSPDLLVLSLSGELWEAWEPLTDCAYKHLHENDLLEAEKDRYVVNMSTGYKTRDGKEIFEDDIIIAEWHYLEPTIVELPDFFYWVPESGLENEFTILGNIHQNPELLKKKEPEK